MIKILIDTSPLSNGNSHRGVGQYTKLLITELEKISDLDVQRTDKIPPPIITPDIIHFPFFDLFFPTLPLWRKAKTVVTIHDVIPLLHPAEYPVGKRGTLSFWRQKTALKTVACVITDSAASAADIEKYLKVPAKKIQVIHLAANPALALVKPAQLKLTSEKFDLPDKYLLYVGDINYNKNLPQLIKALKFLPDDIQLVCVGKNFYPHDIPEWRWIETQIALSNVTTRVRFITNVLPADSVSLSAIYTGAIAYVQPSLSEGFGLPVLEAMICQTPVIAANTSALVEVVGEAGILVEPEAEDFAAAVTQVIGWSKAKRQTQLEKASKHAATFSWAKTAEATAKVYQQLVATG